MIVFSGIGSRSEGWRISRIGSHRSRALRALALFVFQVPTSIQLPAQSDRRIPAAAVATDSTCVATEVSRNTMRLGEREVVVEPTIFVAAGRFYLLAGTPNYQFRGNVLVDRSAIFGVVVAPGGTAQVVPFPNSMFRAQPLRAVALAERKWGVLFAELTEPDLGDGKKEAAIVRLWHGVYDRNVWQSVQPIPMPPSGIVQTSGLSALVATTSTLAFGMPIRQPDNSTDAIVFESRKGRWSFEVVPANNPAYIALAMSSALGLSMAVVQPDTGMHSDGHSLFLYSRAPGWRILGKFVAAGSEVNRPRLAEVGGVSVLSWEEFLRDGEGFHVDARTLRTVLGVEGVTSQGPPTTIDPNVYGFESIRTPEGRLMWVTDRFMSKVDSQQRELRIFRDTGGKPQLIGRFKTPFRAGLAAAASDGDRLVISGGLFRAEQASNAPVVTLLIHYRVSCKAGKATRAH